MDRKSTAVIYKMFYLALCLFVTLYKIIEKGLNTLLELCHEFYPINRRKNFPKIEKLPKHLTLLLGSEQPSHKDLANLVLWCLAARISFVSLYDYKGTLKKNEDKLRLVVEEKKNESDRVIWHSHPDSLHKNGYKGRTVHVKLLSWEDGRGGVVDLVKKLALTSDTNTTISSFNERLKKQFEFPDPDLGVCCGKTFSLCGYPPWQIPVTEFILINTHHNIKFDTFVNLLCRYSKCEQRYGK